DALAFLHLVQQTVDELHDARLHPRYRPLAERPEDQAAHARVQRRIAEDETRRVVLVERRAAELGRELDLLVGARAFAPIDDGDVVVPGEEEASVAQRAHGIVRAQRRVIRIRIVAEPLRRRSQLEAARDALGIGAREALRRGGGSRRTHTPKPSSAAITAPLMKPERSEASSTSRPSRSSGCPTRRRGSM